MRSIRSVVQSLAVLLVAGTLAACGASTTGIGSSSAGSGAAAGQVRHRPPDAHRPCALFSAATVRATLGIRVAMGVPDIGTESSRCQWSQGSDSDSGYTVWANVAAFAGPSLGGEIRAEPHNYRRTTPRIAQDSVYYTAPGPFSNSSVGVIVLAAGYRWQLQVQRPNGIADLATVRAKLLALAQRAF